MGLSDCISDLLEVLSEVVDDDGSRPRSNMAYPEFLHSIQSLTLREKGYAHEILPEVVDGAGSGAS